MSAGEARGPMRFSPSSARRVLCQLQDHIRETLRRAAGRAGLHRVAAVTAADTIYAVDRVSEQAILAWLEQHWPSSWPIELVMEGLEHGAVTIPRGTPVAATRFRLILDPIDGTRCLMYDKRSAWSLAGLAVQRGPQTNLGDVLVAAMTELPTSKSGFVDQFSAVRGRGLVAERLDLASGRRRRFRPRPSRATNLAHGFASMVKFFPEAKAWTAELEEELARALVPPAKIGATPVFDDQYLSTGGQLYELIVGHDRFIADLRPLAYAVLGHPTALSCHPYDICTALIAQEAGCVIEAPDGRPLRAPLDTVTPVAWVGYANAALARRIRPVLRRLLRARRA